MNGTDPRGLSGELIDPSALGVDNLACAGTWEVPGLDIATCGSAAIGDVVDGIGGFFGGSGSGDGGSSGSGNGGNNHDWAKVIAEQSWAGHSDEWRHDWGGNTNIGATCENDVASYIEGVLDTPSNDGNYFDTRGHSKTIVIDDSENMVIVMDNTIPSWSTAFYSYSASAEDYLNRTLFENRFNGPSSGGG